MTTNLPSLLSFMLANYESILTRAGQHLQLTMTAIGIAVAIGVPIGIGISYAAALKKPVLGLANVMQAIPSIALLGFLVPFLGIGNRPAIFMVVVYSLLPIVKNTATGLANVDADTLEAARGIGMSRFQILARVKLPLALPVIMAGIRISSVVSVGLVTITAFIGAGGLGYTIFSGIRTLNTNLILSGAIPACILALSVDWLGGRIERMVTPVCFKERKR